MKKIDEKLLNFVILSEKDCVLEGIVYYLDKNKTLNYFNNEKIKIIKHIEFINAFVVCFTSHNVIKTASQDFVYFVSSVANVQTMIDVSRKIIGLENNKSNLGKDTTIAFIDTGIANHIDFTLGNNRIIKFIDFINNKEKNYDDNGHGTFVTSVASGSGILSNYKYSGIAPKSNIISLKALNDKGEANAVQILNAMQWIFDNHLKYNISVVCMSFGSEPLGINDPIMKGAERLWNEGIVIVCAAGNSGPATKSIKSPGISRKIITVGGLNDNRNEEGIYDEKMFDIADFSSRGPALGKIKPDIIAPSVKITCCNSEGGYKQMSGTSVATPMIAGMCAIIKSKFPTVTPDKIKKFLLTTAYSIGKPKYEQGYGIANLKAFFDL